GRAEIHWLVVDGYQVVLTPEQLQLFDDDLVAVVFAHVEHDEIVVAILVLIAFRSLVATGHVFESQLVKGELAAQIVDLVWAGIHDVDPDAVVRIRAYLTRSLGIEVEVAALSRHDRAESYQAVVRRLRRVVERRGRDNIHGATFLVPPRGGRGTSAARPGRTREACRQASWPTPGARSRPHRTKM